MKTITTLFALVFTIGMMAQDVKPNYEKQGEMVKATYFHENGNVAQTGLFLNGKLHGQWKMYNESGRKIASGEYNQGVKQGKWLFWEGEMLREVDFVDSRIASVTNWNNAAYVSVNK